MGFAKSTKKKKSKVDERDYSISDIVKLVDDNFTPGLLMTLSSKPILDLPTISTGSLGLDLALGIGGLPRGRIVEIYGPEASGKTTLCLHVMANAQKSGGKVAFIDTEHALDPTYAASIGVNVDELLFAQPDCGEDALELTETLLRTKALDCIVIDSVASLTPRAELEGQMGDSHVGLQARLMSQALRKLTGKAKQSDCLVLFTNQLREKIGVMFGSPETTPGGKALKFYASIRMDIRKSSQIKVGEGKDAEVLGNNVVIKVVKNKVAPPFKRTETRIMNDGKGFDDIYDIIRLGTKYDILQKKGAWYAYEGENIGQGLENTKELLADPANAEFTAELRQDIIDAHYKQFEEEEEEPVEEPKKKKKKKSKKKGKK